MESSEIAIKGINNDKNERMSRYFIFISNFDYVYSFVELKVFKQMNRFNVRPYSWGALNRVRLK